MILTAEALLPMLTTPVEVPVLMLVAKLELALREIMAPERVAPAVPVSKPSIVMAPMPVIVPAVVMSQSEESIEIGRAHV